MQKFNLPKALMQEQARAKLPRFSSIDVEFVKEYLYVDFEDDDTLLYLLIETARELVLTETDVTWEELDGNRLASVLILMIVSDLYNSRSTTATDVKIKFSPLFLEMKNTLRGTLNGYTL